MALAAGLFGIGVGAFLIIGLSRSRRILWAVPPDEGDRELADQSAEVLANLNQAVAVIGTHNDVLFCSAQAASLGIIKFGRIGIAGLAKLVEQARAGRCQVKADFEIDRGYGVPLLQLQVSASFLHPDEVLIVGEEIGAKSRVDDTRRDFFTNVTHELKTPVGAISLLAEALIEASDDAETVTHFAKRIRKESVRLAELISQIITLSRLQSDEPLLSAVAVDMDDVVSEAVERCREKSQLRMVSLSVQSDGDAVVVGDRAQLIDAVSNLVANAISYSDQGGRVAVTVKTTGELDDKLVQVLVSDNGIGIKEEDLERIFERFYRVDYARSRESGGTGLGLSIVRHIAAAHGGSVKVWSRLGDGSTFTFSLPAAGELSPLGEVAQTSEK